MLYPCRLVFEPLVLCCSGMGGADKQRVKQLAKRLGENYCHDSYNLHLISNEVEAINGANSF